MGCGFSRFMKEGEGGPGNGPLAPVDVWEGEDVHVDVAGRGRKKLPQGIAVPPSVHKAEDYCPPGEHRHDRFDYCHPEERKHRGAKKPEIEKPDFVLAYNQALKDKREWHEAYREAFHLIVNRERDGGDVQEAIRIKDEAYDKYRDARSRYWDLKHDVMKWRKEQRPDYAIRRRIQVLGILRFKAETLGERQRAEEERDKLIEQLQAMEITKKEKKLPQEVRNMMEAAQDAIKFPLKVKHVVMGGRQLASYVQEDDETVYLSPRSIKMLRQFQKASTEGTLNKYNLERVAFFTTILLHELIHSVNPIDMKLYNRTGHGKRLEEGLTDWTAWYLGKRFASNILGQPFDWEEATGTGGPETKRKAGDQYGMWINSVADMARTAGGGDDKATPYYVTKWKFYTSPELRPRVISEDLARAMVLAQTGIKATPEQMYTHLPRTMAVLKGRITAQTTSGRTPREMFELEKEALLSNARPPTKEDDSELLPWQKRLRAKAWEEGRWSEQWGERPEEKPFQRAVRKVLDGLWRPEGFVFKNDTYPPETPAPTGGGGSGPAAGPGALVPAGMDVRYTGSPPKGVGREKYRQSSAPGGTGAGAVEAMEKHDTPDSSHCEHDPRADCDKFASGEEAGGRTQEEERARVMDWLERHEVPQDAKGHYQFYHATPKTALGSIRREGLKEGSLLETDPESAAHFAARDRELKPSQVVVLPVAVRPHEIRVGMWAQLRVPHRVEKAAVAKSCEECYN